MTHSSKSDWDKVVEKRTKNIGFASRLGAFKDPTPAEIAAAMAIEIESWQKTKGTRPFKVSGEYAVPFGHGKNLRATGESSVSYEGMLRGVRAYQETPMDPDGVLRSLGIDIDRYTQQTFKTRFKRIRDHINYWDIFFLVTTLSLFYFSFNQLTKALK